MRWAELHFIQETAVRWEYRFLYLEREYEATCNRWGEEGWEAVGYTGKSILFKRPLAHNDGPGCDAEL